MAMTMTTKESRGGSMRRHATISVSSNDSSLLPSQRLSSIHADVQVSRKSRNSIVLTNILTTRTRQSSSDTCLSDEVRRGPPSFGRGSIISRESYSSGMVNKRNSNAILIRGLDIIMQSEEDFEDNEDS